MGEGALGCCCPFFSYVHSHGNASYDHQHPNFVDEKCALGCRSSCADGWRYTGKARESPGLRAEYWDTEESTKFLKFCFLLFGFTRKHDNEYQEVLLMILFGFLT